MLYTGTFEAYQGLELLLIEAAARLQTTHPHARVLVVGGEPGQVEAATGVARAHGAANVVFTGGSSRPARFRPSSRWRRFSPRLASAAPTRR